MAESKNHYISKGKYAPMHEVVSLQTAFFPIFTYPQYERSRFEMLAAPLPPKLSHAH